jgi:methylmalonyl-CoA mutase N-terminal domain/subunit
VEELTDRLEEAAEKIFAQIIEMGGDGSVTAGLLRGIEDGWFSAEIAESAFRYQIALEKGEKRVVGVNVNEGEYGEPLEILRVSHEVELVQRGAVQARRRSRDDAAVQSALARMVADAEADRNTIPAMLDAARAEATLGEICNAFKPLWGEYREQARF